MSEGGTITIEGQVVAVPTNLYLRRSAAGYSKANNRYSARTLLKPMNN